MLHGDHIDLEYQIIGAVIDVLGGKLQEKFENYIPEIDSGRSFDGKSWRCKIYDMWLATLSSPSLDQSLSIVVPL